MWPNLRINVKVGFDLSPALQTTDTTVKMPVTNWTLVSQNLKSSYPWTSLPLITNGPMGLIAGPALVTAVTKAGGLGFLGAGYDIDAAEKNLIEARTLASNLPPSVAGLPTDGTLPVGIGFLLFHTPLQDALRLIREYKPVAVWLFAAHQNSDYKNWAEEIRKARPGTKIWVQTNSVADALQLARETRPDVLVLQGGDAGGHGGEKSASVISLVPEVADVLAKESFAHVPLIAAGGIADSRGTAAAVALGAAGVTLGTRFLASEEAAIPKTGYQKAILEASDGGQSTLKHKVFDDLNPKGNIWPTSYDGRGLKNASSRDMQSGIDIAENKKRFAEGMKTDAGFAASIEESRANAWAGTGVGLVGNVKSAGDIVKECRDGAKKLLITVQSRL